MVEAKMHDRTFLSLSCDRDAWQLQPGKIPVLLVALNVPGYYSLPVRILSLLAYENSELRERFDVRYIELRNSDSLQQLMDCLSSWQPHIVGLSMNIWSRKSSIELAERIKTQLPQTTILCGGQEISGSIVDYLQLVPQFDYLIDGEGEIPFTQFLQNWQPGAGLADPDSVSGLRYRKDGQSQLTRTADVVDDLDEIPSVILANLAPATNQSMLGVMIEGSRGCPYRCAFCFEGYKKCKVRTSSVERIVDEISFMAQRGSSYFHLMDPILLNGDDQRLAPIAGAFAELRKTRPETVVSVEAYADRITEQNVKHLEALSIIDLGLQTTNPQTIKEIHRHHMPEKFERGVSLLKNTRATFNLYLISALPYETMASFLEGIIFTVGQQPTRVFFNELLLLNGTELRARAEEYEYDFDEQAPYKVYANKWISRRQLKILQLAANIVEKRYNLSFRSLFVNTPWSGRAEYARASATVRLDCNCSIKCDSCSSDENATAQSNQKKLLDVLREVPEHLEVLCGDTLEINQLVKLLAPIHLAGVNRMTLTTPFRSDITGELIGQLVNYGLLHFKTFVSSSGQLSDQQDSFLKILTNTYKLKGHATIRPFAEIVIIADAGPDELLARVEQVLQLKPYMISFAFDGDLDASQWRDCLKDAFELALTNSTWVRLDESIFREILIDAEADDIDRIIQATNSLGLLGRKEHTAPCHSDCYKE